MYASMLVMKQIPSGIVESGRPAKQCHDSLFRVTPDHRLVNPFTARRYASAVLAVVRLPVRHTPPVLYQNG